MKKIRKWLAFLTILTMMFSLCTAAALAEEASVQVVEPYVQPLFAGAGMLWHAGDVYITNTGTHICVRLVLNKDSIRDNFLFTEGHLGIWETTNEWVPPNTVPMKNGNPIPGKFPEKFEFDPGVTEFQWCFPNVWEPGDQLVIGTHAVMERPETDCYPAQNETLWGDCHPFPGKNWARYIYYVVS